MSQSPIGGSFLLALISVAIPTGGGDPGFRLGAWERHVSLRESSPFKEQRWQFLGPTNLSGRVTDVAVPTPRGATYRIYAATASGGVWRSDNEGVTWDPIFEDAPSTSIGDVTIAPSDPDVVWIGTGEANIFRSSMAGAGVFKSTDGGDHFEHMGLAGTHTIPRIVIHPEDPDVVYVASAGHEWTHDRDRGVWLTRDGGRAWEQVFFADERTGVIDLVMDPSDPETLYAATWERTRKRWNDPRNEEGTQGSGIHRTRDGGRTWEAVNAGLPEARFRGRIGIDLCLAQPDTIYAFIDNYEIDAQAGNAGRDSYGRERRASIKGAEVYRSDDGGDSWRKASESDAYMRRLSATYGWVFGQIRVDPADPETIYVMGLGLNVSNDGGKSFRPLRGMHGDHHALWIDPDNPRYLVNGNDGGIVISYDGGAHWRQFLDNLPAVQFYNVGFDMAEPFHVYGSIQDHGSMRGVVDLTRGRDRIPATEWERAPGGEASTHAADPTDPDTVYSAGFYGSIQRTSMSRNETRPLMPKAAEGEPPLRGQWLAPFILSPHNPRIVYLGLNHLYRSLDRGEAFERVSPDLSHADPARLGDIPYQTIWAIAESPFRFGLIFAGTDDGRVHRTRDGGASWEEITDGLEPDRWISRIVASAHDEGVVYLAQNGKRNDDFEAYLWRSRDQGESWTDVTANLPCGPINVVREDPADRNVLYVGTDLGVYVTLDGARSWHALAAGLPTTFVHDLAIHPRDDVLVAATHGRGMWALDVRPIRELAAKRGKQRMVKGDVAPATEPACAPSAAAAGDA